MTRLLGSFATRALLQTLSFKPKGTKSLILNRGGPRRSDLSKGRGGQNNGVETKSVEDKTAVVNTNSSPRIQKESNPTSITDGQVKDQSITNTSAY